MRALILTLAGLVVACGGTAATPSADHFADAGNMVSDADARPLPGSIGEDPVEDETVETVETVETETPLDPPATAAGTSPESQATEPETVAAETVSETVAPTVDDTGTGEPPAPDTGTGEQSLATDSGTADTLPVDTGEQASDTGAPASDTGTGAPDTGTGDAPVLCAGEAIPDGAWCEGDRVWRELSPKGWSQAWYACDALGDGWGLATVADMALGLAPAVNPDTGCGCLSGWDQGGACDNWWAGDFAFGAMPCAPQDMGAGLVLPPGQPYYSHEPTFPSRCVYTPSL
jgi:hypothetical protein